MIYWDASLPYAPVPKLNSKVEKHHTTEKEKAMSTTESRYLFTVTETAPGETQTEPSVTVLVTDRKRVTEDGHRKPATYIHGTCFKFMPRAFKVTSSRYKNGKPVATFTILESVPGKRIGGIDVMLDGGLHSGTAASEWIVNSEAVLKFVRKFVTEYEVALGNLISSSRNWADDNEELLNEATTVTGISVLTENVQTAFLAALTTQKELVNTLAKNYVTSVQPKHNTADD